MRHLIESKLIIAIMAVLFVGLYLQPPLANASTNGTNTTGVHKHHHHHHHGHRHHRRNTT
jgi:hypothetical protein